MDITEELKSLIAGHTVAVLAHDIPAMRQFNKAILDLVRTPVPHLRKVPKK